MRKPKLVLKKESTREASEETKRACEVYGMKSDNESKEVEVQDYLKRNRDRWGRKRIPLGVA